ncbi:MAG: ABC transporter permease [Micrococcales bacterium]|nr:ABC transporter permease [Micrococcales bacterium]
MTTSVLAAPPVTRVLAQTRFEVSTLLRNGEQLLVSLILPAMVLVGLYVSSAPSLGPGRRIDVAVPGVLALCVLSAAFTSQAIATAFDRRYAVLRYLGVTPLGRGGLVAAKVVATLVIEAIQIVVLGGLGLALGWRPELTGIPYAVLFVLVGTWAFVSLALLLAGTLRAEAVLALANLLWIVLLAAGGVIVPRTQFPDPAGTAAGLLPSAGLADGLRSALVDGSLNGTALLVVLAWAIVCSALAVRLFRWSD